MRFSRPFLPRTPAPRMPGFSWPHRRRTGGRRKRLAFESLEGRTVLSGVPGSEAIATHPTWAGWTVVAGEPLLDGEATVSLATAIREASDRLATVAAGDCCAGHLGDVFGAANGSVDEARVRAAIAAGSRAIDVQIVAGGVLGSTLAGYAAVGHTGTERIYVNADWLNAGVHVSDVVAVLVEEFGHSLDRRLNAQVDTPGDEGQLFAARVLGTPLSPADAADIASENDATTIVVDGVPVAIEQASFTFADVYRGTPSAWSEEANELISLSKPFPTGSRYRFVSADPNAPFFSGNNVSGNLNVLKPDGTTEVVFGVVSRLFKSNGVVQGMYFYVSGPDNIIGNGATDPNEKAFAFVLNPSYFTVGGTYKTSSDPVDTALNAQIVPNSAPLANNDSSTTLEGNAVSGNVLTNDSDSNLDPLTVTQFSVDTNGDGTPEPFSAAASATITGVGTISIAGNGAYTFTPDTGFSGAVPTITYTVSDGIATATASLTITVTPVNQPPTSTNDTKSVDAGAKTLLTTADFGTYADADNDAWTSVRITTPPSSGLLEYFNGITWVSVTANQVVTVADITAGRLRFTADPSTTPSLAFEVSDGNTFSTATYTLTFTVATAANQPPVAVPDTNTVTVAVSNSAQGNVLHNDSDPDGPNSQLTVARASQGASLGGTIVNIPSGGSAIAANGELPTYTKFTVTWPNSGINNQPDLNATLVLMHASIPPGTTALVTLVNGQSTDIVVDGLPLTNYSGVSIQWMNSQSNSRTINNLAMTGGTNISSRVIAVTNAANTLSVGMSVTGTGIPSGTTITSIADDGTYRLVKLSQAYTSATPTDVQFTASTTATITGQFGTLSLQANGAYTYTANVGVANGSVDTFTYELKDSSNATATTTLTITIRDVNQPPVNQLTGSPSVSQGGSLPISTLTVADPNVNLTSVTLNVSSGSITVTAVQASQVTGGGTGTVTITGTQAEINAMLSTLVYTSDPGFSDTATLTVTSTDGGGLQDTDSYTIAVIAAPTVSGTTVNEASSHVYFSVNGAIGQAVTLSVRSGTATLGGDFVLNLQYHDGASWVAYTGAAVAIPGSGALLVRVPVVQDMVSEGSESLHLDATNVAGVVRTGQSNIVDDGTGTLYSGTVTPSGALGTTTGTPDDDRPLTIATVAVNEASSHAIFSIAGAVGQKVASLAVTPGTATSGSDFGTSLEFFDGSVWVPFAADTPIPSGGTLLVRLPIINDGAINTGPYEGPEAFAVVATNTGGATFSGTGIVRDDGTGSVFLAANTTGTPDAGQPLDRDAAVTVTTLTPVVNEASTHAFFRVVGTAGVALTLSVNDLTTTLNLSDQSRAVVEYSADGQTWTQYTYNELSGTGDKPTPVNDGSGKGTVFVRVTIANEQDNPAVFENTESFELVATTIPAPGTVTQSASDTAAIVDDGSGQVYQANLSSGSPSGSATGTDDDRPTFAINDVSVNEAAGTITFTVTKTGSTTQQATVAFTTSDGSANAGSDYTATNNTLTFAAHETTKTITVTVTNDSVPELTESFSVTLSATTNAVISDASGVGTITDDDGNSAPVFTNSGGTAVSSYSFSYAENRTTSDVLGQVYATDADNDALAFAITSNVSVPDGSGGTTDAYAINASTGEITLTPAGVAAFTNDFESTGNAHQITVAVTDGSAPATTVQVTLTETNVDDNNPVFTNSGGTAVSSYSFSYAENRTTSDVLGQVYATDADNDAIAFAITSNVSVPDGSGGTTDAYAINASTGEITLTPAGVAAFTNNFEASGNSHQITVAVTDGSAPATTVQVTLTETNVDDNNPVFTTSGGSAASSYAFSYAENRTTSDVLGQVYATDADNDALTFAITSNVSVPDGNGGTTDAYAINSSTGEITLTAAGVAAFTNNYEAAGNSHQITVAVSDGSAPATTVQVTLTETNVDDTAPLAPVADAVDTESPSTGGAIAPPSSSSGPSAIVPVNAAPTSFGTFDIDSSGRWTYTLDNANPVVEDLLPGQTLTDVVEVVSSDGTTTTVTIQITGGDKDGIPPVSEDLVTAGTLPDGGRSTPGDANGDGFLDALQNNVSSFPMLDTEAFRSAAAGSLGAGSLPVFGSLVADDNDLDGRPDATRDAGTQLPPALTQLRGISVQPVPATVVTELRSRNVEFVAPKLGFEALPRSDAFVDVDPTRDGVQQRYTVELGAGVEANAYFKIRDDGNGVFTHINATADGRVATFDEGADLVDTDGDGLVDRIVLTITDNGPYDFDPRPNFILDPGALAKGTDLAVSVVSPTGSYVPGSTMIYTIRVTNRSVVPVTGARIVGSALPGVTVESWSIAGSTITASGTTSDPVVLATIPVDGTVELTVSVRIDSATATGTALLVEVAPPPGIEDVFLGNNVAADADTPRGLLVVGSEIDCTSDGFVRILDPATGAEVRRFEPFADAVATTATTRRSRTPRPFLGGVRVATGDVTGDGVEEILVVNGRGRATEIRVFTQDGEPLPAYTVRPFGNRYTGGSEIAVADFDGDGTAEVAVSMAAGRGEVALYRVAGGTLVPTGTRFRPFGAGNTGGASVAFADVANLTGGHTDVRRELVVGSGVGTRPTVRVFDTNTVTGTTPRLVETFHPFANVRRTGLLGLAAGRVNADAFEDIIVSAGFAGTSVVEVYGRAATGTQPRFDMIATRVAPGFNGSIKAVNVQAAGVDRDDDGVVDALYVGRRGTGATGDLVELPLQAANASATVGPAAVAATARDQVGARATIATAAPLRIAVLNGGRSGRLADRFADLVNLGGETDTRLNGAQRRLALISAFRELGGSHESFGA